MNCLLGTPYVDSIFNVKKSNKCTFVCYQFTDHYWSSCRLIEYFSNRNIYIVKIFKSVDKQETFVILVSIAQFLKRNRFSDKR